MLVHTVLFWLRPGISDEERAAFAAGLETLKGIAHATAVYTGTPAETAPRPVVERGYDYALTVVLADVAAHDAYQADPIHHAFLHDCKRYFDRVSVIDAD